MINRDWLSRVSAYVADRVTEIFCRYAAPSILQIPHVRPVSRAPPSLLIIPRSTRNGRLMKL